MGGKGLGYSVRGLGPECLRVFFWKIGARDEKTLSVIQILCRAQDLGGIDVLEGKESQTHTGSGFSVKVLR